MTSSSRKSHKILQQPNQQNIISSNSTASLLTDKERCNTYTSQPSSLFADESPITSSREQFEDRIKFVDDSDPLASFLSKQPGGISMVSGTQFRIPEKRQAKCENCEELDKLVKKSKDSIRSLKLSLARLEDKYSGLRKSISSNNGSNASSSQHISIEVVEELQQFNQLLQRRADSQEIEISRLKRDCNSEILLREQAQLALDRRVIEIATEREASDRRLSEREILLSKLKIDITQAI